MYRFILPSLLLCAACSPQIQYVRTEIPEELLAPVPDPSPQVATTEKALARGYIARGGALKQANAQIEGIAEIMEAQ